METTYDLNIAKDVFGKTFENVDELIKYIEEKGFEDESVKKFLDIHEVIWRKEEVEKDGKEMYNEVWEDVTDKYIERIKVCLLGTEDSRLSCGYIADVTKDELGNDIPNEWQNKHHVIYVHGGRNGRGRWNEYLEDFTNFFNKLTIETIGGFKDAYLIKWDVDVADDVFYIWIGVK